MPWQILDSEIIKAAEKVVRNNKNIPLAELGRRFFMVNTDSLKRHLEKRGYVHKRDRNGSTWHKVSKEGL